MDGVRTVLIGHRLGGKELLVATFFPASPRALCRVAGRGGEDSPRAGSDPNLRHLLDPLLRLHRRHEAQLLCRISGHKLSLPCC